MSDAFDPYYSWLGIPPAQQPADYYRLLGINRFEGNQEVIANAAERQIRHIETFKTGLHAKEAEKLLNKLATAKDCLSDVGKKQVYDRAMSGTVAAENSPPVASDSPKAHSPKAATSRSRPRTRNPLVELAKLVLGGIAGLVIGMAILWYGFGMDVLGVMDSPKDRTPKPIAQDQVALLPNRKAQAESVTERQSESTPRPQESPGRQEQTATPGAETTAEPTVGHDATLTPMSTESAELSNDSERLLAAWLRQEGQVGAAKQQLLDAYYVYLKALGKNGTLGEFQQIRKEMVAFRDEGVFSGREPLADAFVAYTREVRDANGVLAKAYEDFVAGHSPSPELIELTTNLRAELKPVALRVVSLQSFAHPTLFMQHGDYLAVVRKAQNIKHQVNATFEIVEGLADPSGVSFRAINVPDSYLAHGDLRLQLQRYIASEGFRQNATFRQVSGLADENKSSFEAINYPGHYIRMNVDGVFIARADKTPEFRADATFDVTEGLFQLEMSSEQTGRTDDGKTPVESEPSSQVDPLDSIVRYAAPTTDVINTAETIVRSLFAEDYGEAKSAADKSTLAAKLLQIGIDTHDDVANRYVTIRAARNVAVESGNVDLAFRAIDALNDAFEIDTLAEQARLVEDLAKASLNDEEAAKLKVRVGELREQAFDRDVYPVAVSLNDLSRGLGKGTEKQWREATDRWTKRLEAGSAAFELVQKALKTLESSPEDAAANLTIGRYRCLLKSEWQIGLPYLAKGSDEKLRAIAERERASSERTPNETLALADSWWDLAAELDGIEQPQVQMRSAQLYESALPNLSGLSAAKAEKRVRELRAIGIATDNVPPELPHRGPAPTEDASKDDFKVMSNSIGMKLVLIPAGEFMMGSPEDDPDANQSEQPQHLVRVAKPFYMSTHEVTVEQFRQFADDSGYKTEAETDGIGGWGYSASMKDAERPPLKYSWRNTGFDQTNDSPVVNVSWNDAEKFCEWLSDQPPSPSVYRLPSEMEWEYACRAGTTTRYYWGDDGESLNLRENVADTSLRPMLSETRKLLNLFSYASWNDGFPFAAPVGTFSANGFGLYDMHGNVSEWCQDAYDNYSNPEKSDVVQQRVIRGGSFVYPLTHARSSQRHRFEPLERWFNLGFRVVRELDVTQ